LFKNFYNLACAGGTDRVPFGFQAAGGVDWFGSMPGCESFFNGSMSLTGSKKAQVFCGNDLSDGEAIVDLS
jgi:hypothetical protein